MSKKNIFFIMILFFVIVALCGIIFRDQINEIYQAIEWQKIKLFREKHRFLSAFAFFLFYVLMISASIPIALFLTLSAGIIFDFWEALFIVSNASSIGASVVFIASRYLFKEYTEKKYSKTVHSIVTKVDEHGVFYLLMLRLTPIVPFFLVNIAMSFTNMKLWQFYVFNQLGSLPATVIYINAASSLRNISSLSDVYTPRNIISIGLVILLVVVGHVIRVIISRKK